MSDPFTQTYCAIWSALLASTEFAALIKSGNQIDLSADQVLFLKDDLLSADTPQVILTQGPFVLQPFGAGSTIVAMSQRYDLLAAFDTLNITPVNCLKWEALRALTRAGPTLGLSFVRGWVIGAGDDDVSGRLPFTKKLRNWGSVMAIEVRMDIARATVVAE
jgi:hypothetical protein